MQLQQMRLFAFVCKPGADAEKNYTYEIGSNSDLVLENTITGNLAWTIENFSKSNYGFLTFPTKFNKVEPLLGISHGGRVIMRRVSTPSPSSPGLNRVPPA
jgi:spore photoproduct lyase